MNVLFWAVLVVLFVIVEIVTIQLVSIWLAAGALVTLLAVYFFDLTPLAQLIMFTVVSAVCLGLSFPYLKKRRSKGFVSTNADLDVGKTAVVIEEISQNKGTGRVTLNGVDWSAVPASGEEIPSGTVVIVTEVQGAKLVVRAKD